VAPKLARKISPPFPRESAILGRFRHDPLYEGCSGPIVPAYLKSPAFSAWGFESPSGHH
jgi:hypothetical protein